MIANELYSFEAIEYRKAIPSNCFKKSNSLAWWGIFKSTFSIAIGILLVHSSAEIWFALPFGWLSMGIGFAGYWSLSHDCIHYTLFKSEKMNRLAGHLLLIPTLYPFESFRQGHSDHHQNTNHIYDDSVWRPNTYTQFLKHSLAYRIVYKMIRSYGWWMGGFFHIFPLHYQMTPEGRTEKATPRRRQSLIISYSVLALLFISMIKAPFQFLNYYLAPWIVFSTILSSISFLQHSSTLGAETSTLNWREQGAAQDPIRELTLDLRVPKLFGSLLHQAQTHTIHHYFQNIPSYHIAEANEAIRSKFGQLPWREIDLNFGNLATTVRNSHLFCPTKGKLISFTTATSQSLQKVV